MHGSILGRNQGKHAHTMYLNTRWDGTSILARNALISNLTGSFHDGGMVQSKILLQLDEAHSVLCRAQHKWEWLAHLVDLGCI